MPTQKLLNSATAGRYAEALGDDFNADTCNFKVAKGPDTGGSPDGRNGSPEVESVAFSSIGANRAPDASFNFASPAASNFTPSNNLVLPGSPTPRLAYQLGIRENATQVARIQSRSSFAASMSQSNKQLAGGEEETTDEKLQGLGIDTMPPWVSPYDYLDRKDGEPAILKPQVGDASTRVIVKAGDLVAPEIGPCGRIRWPGVFGQHSVQERGWIIQHLIQDIEVWACDSGAKIVDIHLNFYEAFPTGELGFTEPAMGNPNFRIKRGNDGRPKSIQGDLGGSVGANSGDNWNYAVPKEFSLENAGYDADRWSEADYIDLENCGHLSISGAMSWVRELPADFTYNYPTIPTKSLSVKASNAGFRLGGITLKRGARLRWKCCADKWWYGCAWIEYTPTNFFKLWNSSSEKKESDKEPFNRGDVGDWKK